MFSKTAPRVYRDDPIFQAIHAYPDIAADKLDKKLEALRNFLDAELTTEAGLQFIAVEILNLKDWFWDESWTTDWKRKTIANYPILVRKRGNKSLLPWMFSLYGLTVQVTSSQGWILDSSVFPMSFTTPWNDYHLVLPTNYLIGTPERNMIELIVKWFVPDIIEVSYL